MSNFHIEAQHQSEWCWAAVTASICHYFFPTQPMDQCTVASKVLAANCCADQKPCNQPAFLQQALDTLAPSILHHDKPSYLLWQEIKDQIDHGFPICVEVKWLSEPAAHYVIIRGYATSQADEQWLDIADPFFDDSTVPYQQFVQGYLNDGVWHYTFLVSKT